VPYTLSAKLSDFTLWYNTWCKNWVNCAVLTGLRTVLSSSPSNRELRSSLRGSLSLPAHTTIASTQGTQLQHPFLAIHSADEHRTIHSFPNRPTTSYFTFYALFSSFRITLWPMWLANSKQQPCFYPPQSNGLTNWQKIWQTWWETCAVPENIQFSFSCGFVTQLNCTVYLRVYGAL
jgi:hypothetical protein